MINHYHFETIDSTSSYLKRTYKELPNLTFISADEQTNGHGRYNRTWYSNKEDNLLFSFLIKDKQLIEKYASLSLAIATVIFKQLKSLNINNVSIKWPNDVYVNDKKICGILLESVSYGTEIDALVIGVGLNVNSKTFHPSIENTSTSIYLETNKLMDIDKFKKNIFKCTLSMLKEINSNSNYLNIVKNNNYLKNKQVYATINNKSTLVTVLDINEDNSLKVLIDNNEINLYSGEITFNKK